MRRVLLLTFVCGCGTEVSIPNDLLSTSEQSAPSVPTAPVTGIEARSAVEQTALAGESVLEAPSVRLTDKDGAPLAGAVVRFSVEAGGGHIWPETVVADANGLAQASYWELGKRAVTNVARASVVDNTTIAPVDFTGTIGTDYAIELYFLSEVTDRQREVFQNATSRWEAVIIGDLPDFTVTRSSLSSSCGGVVGDDSKFAIDDMLIFVQVKEMDGVGGKLASAGPCIIRSADGSAAVGVMTFDSADMDYLETKSLLDTTILHEMGHVLGVGSLWGRNDLVESPSLPSSPGAKTAFNGPLAKAAFLAIADDSYSGVIPVPVENSATAGSADAHWRESIFDGELMSPSLSNSDTNAPLSAITIASIADMGSYQVNASAADPYTIAPALGGAFARAALEDECGILKPSVEVDLGDGLVGVR